MSDAHRILCPSARCEEGAILIGLVGGDGQISYLFPSMEIDDEFVKRAHAGRSPERRFRFAQPCVRERCCEWTGERCGVIDRLVDEVAALEPTQWTEPGRSLPHCSIRPNCRWWIQTGPEACRTCPLVITDLSILELTNTGAEREVDAGGGEASTANAR
jgi:hypothetical protein